MTEEALVEEFQDFLGSVKTSEAISDDLRAAITVPTGLLEALTSALEAGRNIVIAGSAGSGKTHLVDSLRAAPPPGLATLSVWPGDDPPEGSFIRVVQDATAVLDDLMAAPAPPQDCAARVIAINEGPLLELSRDADDTLYQHAAELLRNAQRGIRGSDKSDWPTVLDVGSYDPLDDNTLSRLLGLPLLAEVVDRVECSCPAAGVCPRRQAWLLLQHDEVRLRLNQLLRVVNLGGQPLLFRDLWDFVADLALGGTCEGPAPTSPWFWRVFQGSSALSARLREHADPVGIVFPRAEAHIWHGDLLSDEIELLDGCDLIPPPVVNGTDAGQERFAWLKAQLFFLVSFDSMLEIVRDQVDLELTLALDTGRTQELVAAINRYMTYGTLQPATQVMVLWTDMGFERRTDRARGQVSIGTVQTDQLVVRRSFAVSNHPSDDVSIHGAKRFLVHDATGSGLALSPDVLNLLKGGRSYRSSDRPHTDMEWHLDRFFSGIASLGGSPTPLDVVELNFDAMVGTRRSYRLSRELAEIEPEVSAT